MQRKLYLNSILTIKLIIFALFLLIFTQCKKSPTSSNDPTTLEDIDGNVYETVVIGEQVWMTTNLKVIHYRNGDKLPNVSDNNVWSNVEVGAFCSYDNDNSNVASYGLLYNWYAVNDSRNIAPEGWHIPTDQEWKQLEMYLGMSDSEANDTGWRGTDEGGKLKETGTAHWESPNTGATNESGFSGFPGGYRYYDGTFYYHSYYGYWWSSTEIGSIHAWNRYLYYGGSDVYRGNYSKGDGHSLRCIKD